MILIGVKTLYTLIKSSYLMACLLVTYFLHYQGSRLKLYGSHIAPGP